jgi:hypothetical protein
MLIVKPKQVLLLRRKQVAHRDLLVSQLLQDLAHVHLSVESAAAVGNDLLS